MNEPYGAPSRRGVPHVEANANIQFASKSISPISEETQLSEDIQVPRSPQQLSLQINGSNAGSHEKDCSNVYVESSERGSDTSGDSRQSELQSASAFTESLPSLPLSSLNESSRSMEDSLRVRDSDSSTPTTEQIPHSQDTLKSLSLNGNEGLDGSHADVKLEKESEDSLGPLRSSRQSSSRLGVGKFTPGHKRTASGDIKPVSSNLEAYQDSDANGATRRRSKSTGSPAHGTRIAQLSVHIRTRLSYAAAKIEKARQSREIAELPLRGLATLSSLSSPAPNGAISTSASTPTRPPGLEPSPSDTLRSFPSHHRSQSAITSGKLLVIPKLAPPVDIISSNGDSRRRRPNPNLVPKSSERSPYGRHRRHHSHQEHLITRPLNGSPSVVGPGTPSIPPYRQAPTSTRDGYYGSRTQSQNSAMEQDAIETLMFMSSPENSGYRSSPRPLQPPAAQKSLNESLYSNQNGMTTHSQSSQSTASGGRGFPSKTHGLGLEAGAGDEIDRLLDQMESDSDDDAHFSAHRLGLKGQASKGHQAQSR
ncbi:hypothetical protein N7523_002567 [Penicillium sp. IBT 18751x]|nr:hypothetical protein N7523_002567 [Penicillium sp. IBT 18751x]